MTILEMGILMHYACSAADYRDGDFAAPAVRDAIDRFKDESGLLELKGVFRGVDGQIPCRQKYALSERGHAYVKALKAVPLPVQAWVMPPLIDNQ